MQHGRDMGDTDPGPDGWPADPRHPANRESAEQWRARTFERRMAACESAWRAGNLLAVLDAVASSAQLRQPPPAWLIEAVSALVDLRMTPHERRRHEQDLIHYTRWDAVKELRARRRDLFKQDDDGRGMTWEKARAAVSVLLEGTAAAGGEDAIKASYDLVEREMREGRGGRFFLGR
jgi:hypothetical protein